MEVKLRDIVREVHGKTPRVGRVEISDPALIEQVQAVFPDRQIRAIVARRGTDRTIGPPDQFGPGDAPWRRAIMVRRHDGALTMETQWEDWSRLPKSKVVRTNHSCRLNITVFGRSHQGEAHEERRMETPAIGSTEPSVQPAGCSLDRVQAEVTDDRQGWAFRQLSLGERQWLAKIHKNLGHPHADRLAMTLKEQGYESRIIEAVRQYQCSTCHEGRHASAARPATLRDPLDFNDRVSMDAVIVSTRSGQQFRIYHLVDHGTSYQTAFVSTNNSTEKVIEGMTQAWLVWAGAPGELCVDADKELNSEAFQTFLQSHNIRCRTIAARAHWQNGRAERHGAVLQDMVLRYDKQQAIQTVDEMQQALWAVTQAKNSLSIRRGYSPEVLVLGKATRLPGSIVSDDTIPAHLLAESQESQGIAFRKNLQRRELARKAFHEADNASALRRAMLRQSRPDRHQYCAGEWIMMLVQKGNLPNQSEWIGPLKVMLQSDQNIVWASGSDRLYKGAPEHCRPLSSLEAQQVSTTMPQHATSLPQPPGTSEDIVNEESSLRSQNVESREQQQIETTSIETISQPDEEPSRQASQVPEPPPAENVPVPETDDELFADGGYAFSCDASAPLAWRTELTITDRDIEAWKREGHPHEMAFMATASKKQHREVKLSELTPAEQELFAQAKASVIQNWLSCGLRFPLIKCFVADGS